MSLCMPPQFRYQAARTALEAGKHVFLEKPPGATVSEVEDLKALAAAKGVSLFASWHSRYAPAVEAARAFLASTRSDRPRSSGRKTCAAGIRTRTGSGEPAASASSIRASTRCRSRRISCRRCSSPRPTLDFPENRDAPVAAQIDFRDVGRPAADDRTRLAARPARRAGTSSPRPTAGAMVLSGGGAKLVRRRPLVHEEPEAEYPALRALRRDRARRPSDVDLAPLRHVADAFMLGRRKVVEAFYD